MPTARKISAAAVVNGIIYVFGGTQVQESGGITTTEAYDPATDTWTTKADMPTPRLSSAAVSFQGKIYVIGGWGVHDAFEAAVEVYDPLTDSWSDKAPLPVASGDFGVAEFNGKIYVFGGANNVDLTRDTHEYDPVTDKWTTKAPMPAARIFASATVLQGKIYLLGGNVLGGNGTYPSTSRVDLYDPATDTWQAGVKMSVARSGLAAATVKGKIYAIGGQTGITWDAAGTIYATVEEFALPAAAPQLAIEKSVLLSWKQSGTVYVVQSASSADGPWTKVENNETRVVGEDVHTTVIQSRDTQFFRLSVTP